MRIREMREKAREALRGRWWQVLPIAIFIQLVSLIFSGVIESLSTVSILSSVTEIMAKMVGAFVLWIVFIILNCIFNYVFIGKTIEFNRGKDVSFGEYLGEITSNAGKALKVGIFYIGYILKAVLVPLLILIASLILSAIIPLLSIVFLVSYIIVIVRGLEASYDYSLIYYLANDYKDMELKELFNKSKELMYGNRAKFLVLPITFIGWILLAFIPMFVGTYAISMVSALMGNIFMGMPTWAYILINALVLFIAPVITYMMITIANFYESFKPQEIFNEGYVKPEFDNKKYIIAAFAIFLAPIVLAFLVGIISSFLTPLVIM